MIAHPISVKSIAILALPFMFSAATADTGKSQTGIASVYAYHGSKTASGERANRHGLTAAHRTLPFGTRVKVTNKRNGKSVVVTINDRGPFIRGRVIDLSTAAAGVIGMKSSGLAPVTVEPGDGLLSTTLGPPCAR